MSDEEQFVAEQVVPTDRSGALTVRISQDRAEEFWRVDVSDGAAGCQGHMTTTVAAGDSFMMDLIQGAVSGEPVAWRHLAHWGHDALWARATAVGPRLG